MSDLATMNNIANTTARSANVTDPAADSTISAATATDDVTGATRREDYEQCGS